MTTRSLMAKYTQKQIDKYTRQKYIGEMEKISKNLFKMFRDKDMDNDSFILKLNPMVAKLLDKEQIRLDGEYHQKLKEYILEIHNRFNNHIVDLSKIRDFEMGNLNRLQKLKNRQSYKKEKHRISALDLDNA
jgi:hypothetical protein